MVDAGDSISAAVATDTTTGVAVTIGDAAVVVETPETGAQVTITAERMAITNVVCISRVLKLYRLSYSFVFE